MTRGDTAENLWKKCKYLDKKYLEKLGQANKGDGKCIKFIASGKIKDFIGFSVPLVSFSLLCSVLLS